MPELPEVETVRGGLAPVLEGQRLARVEARRPDLRFPLPPNFVQLLTGATVVRLERRAKYLLARLDREDTLVMHLGMSGRFEIARPEGAGAARPVPLRAGPRPQARPHRLRDRGRRAGHLLRPPPVRLHGAGQHRDAGPASLVRRPGARAAVRRLRRRPPEGRLRRPQAGAQDPAAGPADRGGPGQHLRLRGAAPGAHLAVQAGRRRSPASGSRRWSRRSATVLAEAIAAGGSTLRDFAQADGALGYFQHRFRVYDREGQPCPNDGCSGVIAPPGPGRPLHLLLPGLPEMRRACSPAPRSALWPARRRPPAPSRRSGW